MFNTEVLITSFDVFGKKRLGIDLTTLQPTIDESLDHQASRLKETKRSLKRVSNDNSLR